MKKQMKKVNCPILLAALVLGLLLWGCADEGETSSIGQGVSSAAEVSSTASTVSTAAEVSSTASAVSSAVAEQTPAEKYGVTQEEMNRYFPEGIPEGLTDEEIRAVLRGEGVKVTLNGVETVFNPEAWYASQKAEP